MEYRGESAQQREIHPRAVYTLEEARRLLGLPNTTFRTLLRRGEIKGRKMGRQWRFLGSELLKVLDGAAASSSEERR